MLEAVYYTALAVIIAAAVVIAFHRDIPGGPFGAMVWFSVAFTALAGFEQQPTRWIALFASSVAGAAAWAAVRWRWRRVCKALTDFCKVGGTD